MSTMAVKRGDKPEVVCSYCGKPRHTRDKCYKLNGFPPGFKFTKSKTSGANSNHGSVNQVFIEQPKVNVDQEPVDQSVQLSFSKEQVQKLMALLNDHSFLDSQPKSTNSPTHLANFAGIHSIFSAVNSTTFHNLLRTKFVASPWIIDTGATDHIICSLTLFDSYVPLQNAFVHLPNGMKVQVTHIGTVILNSHIVLHNVLLVPTFTFNLLSASKLTSTKKDCLNLKKRALTITRHLVLLPNTQLFTNCELRSMAIMDRSMLGLDSSTTNYPGRLPPGPDLPSEAVDDDAVNDENTEKKIPNSGLSWTKNV
ncbi:uncharacterized protein LOC127809205 isoform X1 [Diospyros lotus]|uniref:uncharacterized protein LOC127809205 isoform X1 n=1 Tax=Diospyros lotus TaxID=55363 RepID=UPI00224E06E1|nr:uncharacterized protein LOC127809205 isoform X1 [Diospyros lotus]